MLKNIKFFKSVYKLEQMLDDETPKFIFIGRSNVGKSSLINALSGQKKLAKTSSTPGKTQSINYFLVDNTYYVVDMPGYGYAKIPKEQKLYWKKMIELFFKNSKKIKMNYVLVDSRFNIMESDLLMVEYLLNLYMPITIVLTKIDKIATNEISKRKAYIESCFEDQTLIPKIIPTSSNLKKGTKLIIDQINLLNSEP
jgi:GTP-binding protein